MSLRVVFMGTPDFAARALAGLINGPHAVVAVYSQPPRPAGRGQAERRSPVHELAEQHGIPVHTPASLKSAEAQAAFAEVVRDTGADIAVVAAYGLILPAAVLAAPWLGCVNIHASLLPRWRGAAPIQRAILAGDAETGISIMVVDEGLDTGPVLAREAVAIGPAITCDELHDCLAALGARMINEALTGLEAGTLTPQPQPEDGATYAAKLSREEGRLDWRDGAAALQRRVRAFSPWPGAWFAHGGTRMKVLAAEVAAGKPGAGEVPGTVLDASLTVRCGTDSLRLTRVQREGRQPQDSAEFLRGFPLKPGTRLDLPDAPAVHVP
ncbi:MAG: methionyl-tRNA formyltransferase [Alphaproteobacteria bacterium]|nr:methionyl-tRNA formyltransferase [Alphaproteobacteria bacterium]